MRAFDYGEDGCRHRDVLRSQHRIVRGSEIEREAVSQLYAVRDVCCCHRLTQDPLVVRRARILAELDDGR